MKCDDDTFIDPNIDPERYDLTRVRVDVMGDVTFARLFRGLASVGLICRFDQRSLRVVIEAPSVN